MSNPMTNQPGADSSTQREIESKIVAEIEKKENFISNKSVTIEYLDSDNLKKEVTFEFDFFNKEEKIIGEIYAGIDKISVGSIRKVIADCFKMVYAEKLLGYPCDKRLIFIDKNIEKKFLGESWAAKAIKEYGIKVKVEQISEKEMDKLRQTKIIQGKSNIKK